MTSGNFLFLNRLFIFLLLTVFPSAISAQNFWERTSGPGTMTVYDFVFNEGQIIIGTFHGGMYRSDDMGATWQHIENEFSSESVYSLELLSNGNLIAGTGEGIHLSSDNGVSWFHSALDDEMILTITIDQMGLIYAGSGNNGKLFRSTDDGLTWEEINYGSYGGSVHSILTKGTNTILVANGGWIYRSSDAGENWDPVLQLEKLIMDLALSPNGNLNAISEFGTYYLSTNDGATWDSVSTLPYSNARSIFVASNGDLYAGSYIIYRSVDEGQNWEQLNGFHGSGGTRAIDEFNDTFFAGTYFSGVFKSTDGGTNWEQSGKGLNNSSVSLLTKDLHGNILAGAYFGSLAMTTDNGENWTVISSLSQTKFLVLSPNGNLFASHPGFFELILRSADGGYNWESIFEGEYGEYVQNIKVSPDETVFAIVHNKLFKSTDNGDAWNQIQISSKFVNIYQIDINSLGIVFVKSSEGYFRSSDNGENWEQLISAPEGLSIFGITDSNEIYGTASDSGFYKSTDLGVSWDFIYKGPGKKIKAFASNDLGYLFISIFTLGVFRSVDGGYSWQEINSGLDSSGVNALIISDDNHLLAGTDWHGVLKSVNITTGVNDKEKQVVDDFKLFQNYPNPFNPTTKIRYTIPTTLNAKGGNIEGSFVSLKVYDVLGNEIATLVEGEKSAGNYEVEFDGRNLASGIYFYQLKAGSFTQSKKMILLR